MKIENQAKGIEILLQAIPHPTQIKDINFSNPDAIYFTWRSAKYKFELKTISVMQTDDSLLMGSDASILMTALIKKKAVEHFIGAD